MVPTTEKVWEDFNTGLKRFILKQVQDEPGAEDILQDVFLKIHSHIGSLKESDKLQSWIYQIARNAIADFYSNLEKTGYFKNIDLGPSVDASGNWTFSLKCEFSPPRTAVPAPLPAPAGGN